MNMSRTPSNLPASGGEVESALEEQLLTLVDSLCMGGASCPKLISNDRRVTQRFLCAT